jgi:hypothetical protein
MCLLRDPSISRVWKRFKIDDLRECVNPEKANENKKRRLTAPGRKSQWSDCSLSLRIAEVICCQIAKILERRNFCWFQAVSSLNRNDLADMGRSVLRPYTCWGGLF